ncbi:MAG: DUF4830 domain-containing protein [Ruminococcaceae bacterium]|nr:DUF4830 domain-containing protein [Oscillospiraceae bacterium]
MFVCSMKISRGKTILCCLFLLAVVLAVGILPGMSEKNSVPVALILQGHKISDNDARVEYLRSYGWEVEKEAEAIEEIVIPEEFSEVFQKYNELQKEQGFDLEKQKGQRVKRYTYIVTNYPGEPDYVRANLFICKEKVVAGDICSLKVEDGFLHGLEAPTE